MFYIFLTLTIVWFVFMTHLSHQDGDHTRKTSHELAEKLSFLNADVGLLNSRLRRVAHVVVFAILTVFLGVTLRLGGHTLQPLIFTVVWSCIDEATKPLIQGRHFSWHDVGLNLIGVVIGYGVLSVIIWTI